MTTIILAAGLVFAAIVGNAALFGNALCVNMTIPTQMESSGLSKETAEQLFIANVNRHLQEQVAITHLAVTPPTTRSATTRSFHCWLTPVSKFDLIHGGYKPMF